MPDLEDKTSYLKEKLEEILQINRYPLLFALSGLILIVFAVFIFKSGYLGSNEKVQVLSDTTQSQDSSELLVEISGAVEKPGVYKLPNGSRIEDLLIAGGGLAVNADRTWIEKTLNRAAKISDGQKIYIPRVDEADNQSNTSSARNMIGYQTTSSVSEGTNSELVNINTASLSELDRLPGIGPVYGQSIIDHRMYSSVDELLSKGVLKKNVYDKIKDLVAVY